MPLIFMAIVYCMVGFSPYISSFFSIYFTYLLVSLCASGFGYTISALAPSPQWASSIAPPLITPLFIFCGVLVKLDTLPPYIQWLKYLSWFYYGTENLFIIQWKDTIYCQPKTQRPDGIFECVKLDNGTILPLEDCSPNDTSCSTKNSTSSHEIQRTASKCNEDSYEAPGTWQLGTYGFHQDNYTRNVICLIAWLVFFRLLGLVILTYRFRKSKR